MRRGNFRSSGCWSSPAASPAGCTSSPRGGAQHEAARRVGDVAGRAASGRAELRAVEAELADGVVDLQEAADRARALTVDDTS